MSLIVVGCGASPTPPPSPPQVLELEASLLVTASGEPISDRELAEEGVAALGARDFGRCRERLELLLEHFESSPYSYPSRYNLGLCQEEQGAHLEAAASFALYVKEARERREQREQLDGRLRLGVNLLKGERPQPARQIFDQLLTREFTLGADRAECHLRRAQAQRALREVERAQSDLDSALQNAQRAGGDAAQLRALVTEIHFERGELFREIAEQIELRLPLAAMKRAFNDKTRFFRKSMRSYLSAVQQQERYWSPAAGNRLGSLYETFYHQVTSAEHPPEFNELQRRLYFFKIKTRLAPMLQEALTLYERTLSLGARLGSAGEWIEATEAGADRLRVLVLQLQRELDEERRALGDDAPEEQPEGAAAEETERVGGS